MDESIRLYMDQHFPAPVTRGLRRHGIDSVTAQEADRCEFSDADQLVFATADGRVLVTFDTDFLALHQSGVEHAGIVWCPAQKYGAGDLIQASLLLHGVLDSGGMRNHLECL